MNIKINYTNKKIQDVTTKDVVVSFDIENELKAAINLEEIRESYFISKIQPLFSRRCEGQNGCVMGIVV